MTAFVTAGGGFLLSVLWFDLMFDVQTLRHRHGPIPDDVLASIAAYYRRVTTAARPMNRLVAVVMLGTLTAIVVQLVRDDAPRGVAWTSLALTGAAIGLAASHTFAAARRLGTRADTAEVQTKLARAICRDHLVCLALIVSLLVVQLAFRALNAGAYDPPVRTRRTATFVTLTIVCALLAPGVAVASTSAPDDWDERIQPFVDFVEHDRGVEFDHPVRVEFLAEKAFTRRLERDDDDLTRQDRKDIEQSAAALRAVGLVTGNVDLFAAMSDLDADTVLGFYDFDTKAMVVRGTKLRDVETRATVVHELTHALQDQRYGIGKLYDRTGSSGEIFGLDALTEGEAVYVESDYIASLSQREQDEYYGTDTGASGTTAEPGQLPEGVPEVLSLLSDAPYTLGLSFVIELDAAGHGAVHKAFAHPPVSDEQIIDPVAWDGRDRPRKVTTPSLQEGERKAAPPDEVGALSLYLMLASRIDPLVALDAVTGWGGDRYRGFTRDGVDCVRAAVRGDTRTDTTVLGDALDAWAAALPMGMATIERGNDEVTFTACASPEVTDPDATRLDRAFYFVLDTRLYNASQAIAGGLPPDVATCVGQQSVSAPEFAAFEARFYDEGIDETDLPPDELRRYKELVQVAIADCGA